MNNKKIGIIIQARIGSTRLPGKVMLDLEGKPVLQHVVERCKESKVDEVIVATSINPENDIIEKLCAKISIPCFRASEDNVLNRYYECAKKFNLNVVIRITADCPLIDPTIINKAIDKFNEGNYDYVSNIHNKRTYPRGLDTEVFSFDVLKKMDKKVKKKEDKEHVTLYLLRNITQYKTAEIVNDIDYSYLRWTLDEKADFKLIKEIYSKLYKKGKQFYMKEVIKLLKENKELQEINKNIKQKEA